MIDVEKVIQAIPTFNTYCSVAKLHELVSRVRQDSRFEVLEAGTSVNGVPIHHVRFGRGAVKALVVGGPHAMEPVGSLTVFSLLSLLLSGRGGLATADVEWNVIPCIDPDGAMLNEGWTQHRFSLENYIKNYWVQPRQNQVDFTFPISHGEMVFNRLSHEALVLKGVIDHVLPDFFFSLHNVGMNGGTWCGVTRAIDAHACAEIQTLVTRHGLLIQPHLGSSTQSGGGVGIRDLQSISMKEYYDNLTRKGMTIHRELLGEVGVSSGEYLMEVKPDAFCMIVEVPIIQHPHDVSDAQIGISLRHLKLRLDAENKYLASVILEEFEACKADLDRGSPFYQKLLQELVARKEDLCDGISSWYAVPIRELLFSPDYSREATERDRARAAGLSVRFLANLYAFVRLLGMSTQTAGVRRAKDRLDRLFAQAFRDLREYVDFEDYEVIECDRLARVQLGCGLVGLNSVLARAQ